MAWVIKSKAHSFDEDQLEPLTSLLARCPQLSSILLDLQGEVYSPTTLVAALGDQRHPGIEDFALGYTAETAYGSDIAPTEIAQLFPSLKSFEGPVFLFQPLILSALTGQIEKLIIVTHVRDFSDVIEEDILVNMLRTIVNAAEQLEEIETHSDSVNYGEVMELIAQVRGLRYVTLNESVLGLAAEGDGEKLEWDAFAVKLRHTCPRLRTIYHSIRKFDRENREKIWELRDGA
ncbi:hypothetical protein RSAG8_06730, partial [Rhizoctonia solani AG-8 WAC10335]